MVVALSIEVRKQCTSTSSLELEQKKSTKNHVQKKN